MLPHVDGTCQPVTDGVPLPTDTAESGNEADTERE